MTTQEAGQTKPPAKIRDENEMSGLGIEGHTPTPWEFWIDESPSFGEAKAYIAQAEGAPYTPNYSDVAMTHSGEKLEVQKANAEFIVRACNSHEALVKALRSYMNLSGDDFSGRRAAYKEAVAALAAAGV